MFRKLIILVLLFIFLSRLPISVVEAEMDTEVHQVEAIEARELDPRALILHDYLAQYDSPLQYHAQDFIDAADTYDVDWKLVPAIAGVESTFGKAIPGGHEPSSTSYNGWGWGIYGDNRIGFASWRDGIFTVTKGLREGYMDKGLTTPMAMNRVYASSPTWGQRVNYFMNDIDKFSKISYRVAEPSKDKLPAQTSMTETSPILNNILLTSLPEEQPKPEFLSI